MRVVMSIAGSDSSAGAGIQADLKTIAACGAYGTTVLTAVTAQNTGAVRSVYALSASIVRAQLDAVLDAHPVASVKSGMLAAPEIVEVVAETLRLRRPAHYVLDPVLAAESGGKLLRDDAIETLRRNLVPLATLVTPNSAEAQVLTGVEVTDPETAVVAGKRLLAAGCTAVLVTGGHFARQRTTDVLVRADGVRFFAGDAVDSSNTHGTGCTLAAAIATFLARGRALDEAIGEAKRYVTEAIRNGVSWGGAPGTLQHFFPRPDDPTGVRRVSTERPTLDVHATPSTRDAAANDSAPRGSATPEARS